MANNARVAHVKRVYQLNADGTVNKDIYIDVLRIDKLPVIFQADAHSGAKGQIINCNFKWNDDVSDPQNVDDSLVDAQQEHGNAARTSEQLTISNPDDPNDPTQQIKLWLVKGIRVSRDGLGSGVAGQFVNINFRNGVLSSGDGSESETTRKVTVIEVVNNDLGGRDIDVGQTLDWDAYVLLLKDGATDDGQHLDVEVTDRFKVNFQADEITGAEGQIVLWNPDNKEVEALFARGDPAASVVRTDPLQTIVNVGFGGLAVIFGPQDQNAPPFTAPTIVAAAKKRRVDELSANG